MMIMITDHETAIHDSIWVIMGYYQWSGLSGHGVITMY